ncbi:MAG: VWA domain-containing protein [Bacteriovoracaceae bacterium]|jgi:Ca-activated chloride channel family protein|nr:VWA domain-containing protein [Bacteriovoracaceae bacterium]
MGYQVEYKAVEFGILGLVVTLLWTIDFWKVLHKSKLVIPVGDFKRPNYGLKIITFIIGLSGWLLISFSLTGPRKPLKNLPSNIEVNDIFLVVDVSRSMLADDLKPNRLEVAKQKLRDFAALRPTDRIGIIIFSEKVFTLLPLTTDPSLVDKVIADIKIGFLGSGTNIGDALALAVARGQNSQTKNKVIILLTDGVNNVGNMPPLDAARTAKDYNMKVYTIGLGTTKSRLPIGRDAFGRQQYQNIPGGSIDIKTLDEISKLTGGKSFMADSENSLNEILSEIQKLEKTKINSSNQVVYDELFFPYLLFGVLLFLLSDLMKRFLLREAL